MSGRPSVDPCQELLRWEAATVLFPCVACCALKNAEDPCNGGGGAGQLCCKDAAGGSPRMMAARTAVTAVKAQGGSPEEMAAAAQKAAKAAGASEAEVQRIVRKVLPMPPA